MRCHQSWLPAWWKLMSCLLEEGTFSNLVLPDDWSAQLASSCCSKENGELGVKNSVSVTWWRAVGVSSATPNASSTELCCFGSLHFKTAAMKDQLVLLW